MEQFAIESALRFETGQGGMPKIVIDSELATAEIYLHGAHITSFAPKGNEPMLWMSDESEFTPERPIRGGVPVCWPWFGKPSDHPEWPQHGFARTSEWEVASTKINDDGLIFVVLRLTDSEESLAIWPHKFELKMEFSIGSQLTMRLACRNTGNEAFESGAALHTYFAVENIQDVVVTGLAGREYIDQLDNGDTKSFDGDLIFDREIDRIVIDTDDQVAITEESRGRKVLVTKGGSRSTVVWNPWIEKSKKMADFPDDGYKTMLCVETTNAAEDVRTVEPNRSHTLSQTIRYVEV